MMRKFRLPDLSAPVNRSSSCVSGSAVAAGAVEPSFNPLVIPFADEGVEPSINILLFPFADEGVEPSLYPLLPPFAD